MRYFDAPPMRRVTAGGRVIAELRPDDDFEWSVVVPADDVARAEGAIAIESDRVYLPGAAEGTGDEYLGVGLADVVFGAAILARARELGLGRELPR